MTQLFDHLSSQANSAHLKLLCECDMADRHYNVVPKFMKAAMEDGCLWNSVRKLTIEVSLDQIATQKLLGLTALAV